MSALPEPKTIRDLSNFEKQLNRTYRKDMVALFILLALTGLVIMGFTHRHGPWIDGGAVEQLAAARNLALGRGLNIPRADGTLIPYGAQPPLYSLLLSLIYWLNLKPLLVVSLFNMILFSGILFLIGWGLWRVTNSVLMGLGSALLFALTPPLIMNFDGATPYGLLTFLVIANFVCLAFYLIDESRTPFLLAILTAMLAFFTDFLGGACILTGAAMILLFGKKKFGKRLLFSTLYASGTALPLIIWQLFHLAARQTAAVRTLSISMSFRDALFTYARQLMQLFLQWFPGEPAWISQWLQTREAFFTIGAISLALFIVLVMRFLVQRDELRPWIMLLSICLVFLAAAIVIIFAESYLQTQSPPTLTMPMLSPLYPFLVVFFFGSLLGLIISFNKSIYLLAIPIALLVLWLAVNVQPSLQYVYTRYNYGSTYTTPQWQNSELIEMVNSVSAQRTYFTNEPAGVLLYHYGNSPYDISHYDTAIPFLQQEDMLVDIFKEASGTLLLFQPAYLNPEEDNQPVDFTTFTEGLELIYRGADGEIYVLPSIEE